MFKKLNSLSKTERKLLAFISVKDGELYERQIAEGAGVSAGSANAILKAFARLGLVSMSRKGRMVFYGRNDASPALRQFKISATVNSLMPLIALLRPVCRRIVMFGSCAEGRNGEKSDIDLLIISGEKQAVRRALDKHRDVQAIILDSVEYANLREKDPPLYARIARGIELLGDEDERV